MKKIATIRIPDDLYEDVKLCKEFRKENTWNKTITYLLEKGLKFDADEWMDKKLLNWEKELWHKYGVYFYSVK